MKNFVLAAIIIASVFAGCKNDLDVTADYKEITVVYGLLNQRDTAHYIKINKAYLGEGSAFVMAGVADSINYQAADLDVKLEEYNANGVLTNSFTLSRTVNEIAKDTGLFATDANVLYKLKQRLDSTRSYKLIVNNNKTGNTITSQTNLIKTLTIQSPALNSTINLIPINNLPFTVKFKSEKYAQVYSLTIRFNYFDDVNGVLTSRFVDWRFPNVKSSNANGGEDVLIPLDGDGLFRVLQDELEPPPVGTVRRSGKLQFMFYAGGEELSTYLDVNGPSNTLQQEKPEYTNIVNGLGIFSSRLNINRNNITMAPQSLDSLLNGRFTDDLGFVN